MSECVFEREGVVAVFRSEERVSAHFGEGAASVHVEWSLRSRTLRAGVSASEECVLLSLGLPPAALYVGADGPAVYRLLRRHGRGLMGKAVEAYVAFDGDSVDGPHVHWNLGTPTNEWSSKTPRWRNGGFFLWSALFGATEHARRVIETRPVTFHAPDGDIAATAELYESTWTMPRWPGIWKRMRRVRVDVPEGIDDGHDKGPTYSATQAAWTIADAVGSMLGDVLRGHGACGGATIGERVENA